VTVTTRRALRRTRHVLRDALRRCGYEIRRTDREPAPAPTVWDWMRETLGIRTVVDVGAHTGEFAEFLVDWFRPAVTYAFEPQPSCQAALRARSAALPNFHVFDVALSDRDGTATLFQNPYGPATSLRATTPLSAREFPQTAGSATPVEVRLARLDDVLEVAALPPEVLVKIDVQGVEDQVIRGGRTVLSRARCVVIEMSFVALYEGQPLFEEIHDLLVPLGYRFAGLRNHIDSLRSGQPLFAHCVYLRGGGADGAP